MRENEKDQKKQHPFLYSAGFEFIPELNPCFISQMTKARQDAQGCFPEYVFDLGIKAIEDLLRVT
jgi:hypothetical protein